MTGNSAASAFCAANRAAPAPGPASFAPPAYQPQAQPPPLPPFAPYPPVLAGPAPAVFKTLRQDAKDLAISNFLGRYRLGKMFVDTLAVAEVEMLSELAMYRELGSIKGPLAIHCDQAFLTLLTSLASCTQPSFSTCSTSVLSVPSPFTLDRF